MGEKNMDYDVKCAHRIGDRKQTVEEHLKGVAQRAVENSIELLKPECYTAGLIHDIGKYSVLFQKRLYGDPKKYEHSVCGAIELGKLAKNDAEKAV